MERNLKDLYYLMAESNMINMVKHRLSATIDEIVLKKFDEYWKKEHPGASKSHALECILRERLMPRADISVAKP